MGLFSFYRPLLNLPAKLPDSVAFILPFPCCHLYQSPDSRVFSYFLDSTSTCSHLLLPFHLLASSSVSKTTGLAISQPLCPLSSHFYFDLVLGPTQLPAPHPLKVPQKLPVSRIPLAFLFAPLSDHPHLLLALLRTSSHFPRSQNTHLCLNYSTEPQSYKYLPSSYQIPSAVLETWRRCPRFLGLATQTIAHGPAALAVPRVTL